MSARTRGEGAVVGEESRPRSPALAGIEPPRALYVHFPFCVHRCHYCDFSVSRARRPPVDEWLEVIGRELEEWRRRLGWSGRPPLDTIYVGGGTPSLLGDAGMAELGRLLRTAFEIEPETEWTAEANPASFDASTASAWRREGVNRISLGIQALDDGVLRWLGRLHDAARARQAVRVARAARFRRVSVDLMFGLPGGVERRLEAELDELLDLGVGHVSVYGLTVEPRTPLARRVELGRVRPATGSAYAREYRLVSDTLRSGGYVHYEVSNFARPGHESRHNWYYWDRSPYLGLGPSAHGFLPPYRLWNEFRWDRYRDAVRRPDGALAGWERLSADAAALERVWLGLRTRRGLSLDGAARAGHAERLDAWLEAGWIERDGERLIATTEGWLRMDTMTTELASPAPRARDRTGPGA